MIFEYMPIHQSILRMHYFIPSSIIVRYYKKLIQVGTDDGTELRRYAEKKMIGYKGEASRWEHYAKKNESTLDVLYDNLGMK